MENQYKRCFNYSLTVVPKLFWESEDGAEIICLKNIDCTKVRLEAARMNKNSFLLQSRSISYVPTVFIIFLSDNIRLEMKLEPEPKKGKSGARAKFKKFQLRNNAYALKERRKTFSSRFKYLFLFTWLDSTALDTWATASVRAWHCGFRLPARVSAAVRGRDCNTSAVAPNVGGGVSLPLFLSNSTNYLSSVKHGLTVLRWKCFN